MKQEQEIENLAKFHEFVMKLIREQGNWKHCIALISFSVLMCSIFQMVTIISFCIFVSMIGLLSFDSYQKVRAQGLINYLPDTVKRTLINRSIFDILCDIWFVPNIMTLIKTLIGPFIYQVRPEEYIFFIDASMLIEQLDDHYQEIFLTKGIVNVLPRKFQNILLADKRLKEISETENRSENENEQELSTHDSQTVQDETPKKPKYLEDIMYQKVRTQEFKKILSSSMIKDVNKNVDDQSEFQSCNSIKVQNKIVGFDDKNNQKLIAQSNISHQKNDQKQKFITQDVSGNIHKQQHDQNEIKMINNKNLQKQNIANFKKFQLDNQIQSNIAESLINKIPKNISNDNLALYFCDEKFQRKISSFNLKQDYNEKFERKINESLMYPKLKTKVIASSKMDQNQRNQNIVKMIQRWEQKQQSQIKIKSQKWDNYNLYQKNTLLKISHDLITPEIKVKPIFAFINHILNFHKQVPDIFKENPFFTLKNIFISIATFLILKSVIPQYLIVKFKQSIIALIFKILIKIRQSKAGKSIEALYNWHQNKPLTLL